MLKEEKMHEGLSQSRLNEIKNLVFDCEDSLGLMLENLNKLSPKECQLFLNYVSECLGRQINVSDMLNLSTEDLQKIGLDLSKIRGIKILNSNSSEQNLNYNSTNLGLLDRVEAIREGCRKGR